MVRRVNTFFESLRFPVQTPVLYCLSIVLFANCITPVEIGNGAGHLEDTSIGAGRETEAVGDQLQHAVAAGVQFAIFLDGAGGHLGVAVDFGPLVALELDLPRTLHPLGNGSGTFCLAPIGKIAVFNRRHFDMYVDQTGRVEGMIRSRRT